jgi:hypothetical protein
MSRSLLFLLFAACSNTAIAYFPSDAATSLLDYAHGKDKNAPLCINVDGRNASLTFIKMLRKKLPNASIGSDCTFDGSFTIHKPTKLMSYNAYLSDFRQISPKMAVANYSTYGGPLAGNSSKATFIKARNGHWYLKSLDLERIS